MPMPAPINRRQLLSLAGGVAAAPFVIPSAVRAQEAYWPARPVRYVNGFPPGGATNVLAIGTYAKMPYDPVKDFTFISGMWQLPNILTARKDFFSQDARELFAAFRKEPRKYTYASA